jgi:hypothetical protein
MLPGLSSQRWNLGNQGFETPHVLVGVDELRRWLERNSARALEEER